MKDAGSQRGFSLIELLGVITILAVLLALLLPALRGARVSAGRAAMLSNLRGIGISFEVYTQTYDTLYPFHDPADWLLLSPDRPPSSMVIDGSPWALRSYWPAKFHSVAPWRDHFRSWVNPGRFMDPDAPWNSDEAHGIVSCDVSYKYSCSFQGRPRTWPVSGASPAPSNLILRAPVRAAEVAQPSAKALCIDADRAYLRRDPGPDDPRGILLTDGAAGVHLDREATAPVQNLIDNRTPGPWHDTPRGVRGRDLN